MSTIITLTEADVEGPLVDRVLMLDTSKSPRFQCFGFSVSRNAPIQVVPRHAQEVPIRRALAAGILIDITGKEEQYGSVGKIVGSIDKAVKSGAITDLGEQKVGPQILIGKDAQGASYIIIPKDEDDLKQMQEELRLNGFIRRERPKPEAVTGLSSVYEEDIDKPDNRL